MLKQYLALIIWTAILAIAFGILWYKGQIKRFAAYVQETQEELKKCTWPTWDELRGSTVVVLIAILLMGGFTVVVDFMLALVVKTIIQQ